MALVRLHDLIVPLLIALVMCVAFSVARDEYHYNAADAAALAAVTTFAFRYCLWWFMAVDHDDSVVEAALEDIWRVSLVTCIAAALAAVFAAISVSATLPVLAAVSVVIVLVVTANIVDVHQWPLVRPRWIARKMLLPTAVLAAFYACIFWGDSIGLLVFVTILAIQLVWSTLTLKKFNGAGTPLVAPA